MLLGEFEHSLDDKGRLFIPAKLRDALGKHFYLCKGFDGCLMVYDEASWQRFTEKLNNLSMGLKKNRDLKRFFFSGASDVSCDKQGRVLLASNLRRYAGIDKDVVIIGVGDKAEIWARPGPGYLRKGQRMEFSHVSVLLQESVDWIVTDPDGIYVDCTLGGAGHSHAIASRLHPDGWLIGIDQDDEALAAARERLADVPCRVSIVKSNFKNLLQVLRELHIDTVNGVFFDLGVSSHQLDTPERGFSYMHDGPLDMRMDQENPKTAAQVVNTYSEADLAGVIWRYGEERWAKRIAQFIVAERKQHPIETTGELVTVIKKAIPKGAREDGPHPAKRTFQALRIEVNDELNILDQVVEDAVSVLKPGGRIGVITFQSLEDRIIKQKLAQLHRGCICPPHMPCVCGRKPVIGKPGKLDPGRDEVERNPRARSARLRFAEKLGK